MYKSLRFKNQCVSDGTYWHWITIRSPVSSLWCCRSDAEHLDLTSWLFLSALQLKLLERKRKVKSESLEAMTEDQHNVPSNMNPECWQLCLYTPHQHLRLIVCLQPIPDAPSTHIMSCSLIHCVSLSERPRVINTLHLSKITHLIYL